MLILSIKYMCYGGCFFVMVKKSLMGKKLDVGIFFNLNWYFYVFK